MRPHDAREQETNGGSMSPEACAATRRAPRAGGRALISVARARGRANPGRSERRDEVVDPGSVRSTSRTSSGCRGSAGTRDRRERLGAIGFHVGARAVFRTLMRLPGDIVAGAMWHPQFRSTTSRPRFAASRRPSVPSREPLVIGVGGADTMQPLEAHRRSARRAPLPHVEVEVSGRPPRAGCRATSHATRRRLRGPRGSTATLFAAQTPDGEPQRYEASTSACSARHESVAREPTPGRLPPLASSVFCVMAIMRAPGAISIT